MKRLLAAASALTLAAPAAEWPAALSRAAPPDARIPGGGRYFVQAGAFVERRWADARVTALRSLFDEERDGAVRLLHDPADRLYRVRVGPVRTREAAQRLETMLVDESSGENSLPVIVREQDG